MAAPDLRRQIPSISSLLSHPHCEQLTATYGNDLTVEALRSVIDYERQQITLGEQTSVRADEAFIGEAADYLMRLLAPTLQPVINATGVIIHTNLGRAPLSDDALAAVQTVGSGYSTLEFDLETGKRGKRSLHAEALLTRLTGAEAAFVVNNNAAATMLALASLAGDGQGVVVSRGQLVEIGGGYRMPDVMAASGARLVEVGTTNRTHLHDYENAIDETTTLLMRVHHSNYKVIGFTTEPLIEEIATAAHQHGLLFVDDLGSGCLFDTTEYGLSAEPTVQHSLDAGADLLLFSGDKLLGGPQAGILLGRRDLIERIKKHPLARAVRPDKLCLAALSATLAHYLKDKAPEQVPIWQMIATPVEIIRGRVAELESVLNRHGIVCSPLDGESTVGGGSIPGETLPTVLLALSHGSAEQLQAQLRRCDIPIIARITDDQVVLDVRTVLPRQWDTLTNQLKDVLAYEA